MSKNSPKRTYEQVTEWLKILKFRKPKPKNVGNYRILVSKGEDDDEL
jgi:hypothetical protein